MQGLEVFTDRKNVLTGHRIPVIGFQARQFIEFSQLPVHDRRKTLSLDMQDERRSSRP